MTDLIEYPIKVEWQEAYQKSLLAHIEAVREAGKKLDVPWVQLMSHDKSKYSDEEFPHYARQFHGDTRDPDGFAKAWLHHIHFNKHHPEFWMFPGGFTLKGSSLDKGKLQMSENYALEMIADWMGSSYVYTGSWDMSKWLTKRLWLIPLHSYTRAFVKEVLVGLGYELSRTEITYTSKETEKA